jgi:hypothetical protein
MEAEIDQKKFGMKLDTVFLYEGKAEMGLCP